MGGDVVRYDVADLGAGDRTVHLQLGSIIDLHPFLPEIEHADLSCESGLGVTRVGAYGAGNFLAVAANRPVLQIERALGGNHGGCIW